MPPQQHRPDVQPEPPLEPPLLQEVICDDPVKPEPDVVPAAGSVAPIDHASAALERAAVVEPLPKLPVPSATDPSVTFPSKPVSAQAVQAQALPKQSVAQRSQPPQVAAAPAAQPPTAFVEARRRGKRPPKYPESERRFGREGFVVLSLSVAADGTVQEVQLKQADRSAAFNRSALKAARRWTFEPATRAGRPVASKLDVEVVFELPRR